MKLAITKYFIFVVFLFVLFSFFKREAFATVSVMAAPDTSGFVLTSGTNSPIADVWVKWTDNVDDTSDTAVHHVRYTKTDSLGAYSFPSWQNLTDAQRLTIFDTWIKPDQPSVSPVSSSSDLSSQGYVRKASIWVQDGFGCVQNTHEITAIIPTGWLGAFQGVVLDNINNDLQNQIFPTIYYAKPPSCVVDGPTSVMAGQNYTYSAAVTGTNLTNLKLWKSPTSPLGWSNFIDKSCSGAFCTDSRATNFSSSADTYYVTCNGFQTNNSHVQRCTGEYPGVTTDNTGVPNNWASCGPNGTLTVDVRKMNCSNLTIANSAPFESTPQSKGYNWRNVGLVPFNNNGFYLDDVDRYKAGTGPCFGKNNCKFDTRTSFIISGKLVESITAYGKAYNWDISGSTYTPWATNGTDLTGVTRFINPTDTSGTTVDGPCAGKSASGCTFDTRTSAPQGWESITAYGKYWNYNGNTVISTGNLTSIPRYTAAGGPCEGKSGTNCTFGTRAYVKVGDQQWESITAYGKYWNYNGNILISSGNLTSIPRYTAAGGPCEGMSGTGCNFDTRTVITLGNNQIESVTASSIDKGSILTGQTGISFSADFASATNGFEGAVSACKRNSDGSVNANCKNAFNLDAGYTFPGSSDSKSQSYTFTEPGTYDVLCRAWKGGVGECRGGSSDYLKTGQYACPGPVTVRTIKVYTAPQIASLQIGNTAARSFSGTYGVSGNQSTQGGSNWLNPLLITLNINAGSSTSPQSYVAFYSRSAEFTDRATVIADIKNYLKTAGNKDKGFLLAYGKGINGNTENKHYVYNPNLNEWRQLSSTDDIPICNGTCNADLSNELYSVRIGSNGARSWQVTFDQNLGYKTFYTMGYLVDGVSDSLYDFQPNASPNPGPL